MNIFNWDKRQPLSFKYFHFGVINGLWIFLLLQDNSVSSEIQLAFLFKNRNKTRVPIFTTSIRHHTSGSSQNDGGRFLKEKEIMESRLEKKGRSKDFYALENYFVLIRNV